MDMIMDDQTVEYFSISLIRAIIPDGAPIIFIYQNPDDYPEKFVARLYNGKQSTHIVAFADTLEELRTAKPDCMDVIERQKDDPPKVIETWL